MAGNNPYYSNYNDAYSQFLGQQQQQQNAASAAPTNNAGYVTQGGYANQSQYYNNQGQQQRQAVAPSNTGMMYQQQQPTSNNYGSSAQQQQPPSNNNSYGTATSSYNSYTSTSYNPTSSGYGMPQQSQPPATIAPNPGYSMTQQQQYSNPNYTNPAPAPYSSWGGAGPSGIPNQTSNYGNSQYGNNGAMYGNAALTSGAPGAGYSAAPPSGATGGYTYQTTGNVNSQQQTTSVPYNGNSTGGQQQQQQYSSTVAPVVSTRGGHNGITGMRNSSGISASGVYASSGTIGRGNQPMLSSYDNSISSRAAGIAASGMGGQSMSQQTGQVMGNYNQGTTMSSSYPTTSSVQGAPGYSNTQPSGSSASLGQTVNSLMTSATSQLNQSASAPSSSGISQASASMTKMPAASSKKTTTTSKTSYNSKYAVLHPPPGVVPNNAGLNNMMSIAANYITGAPVNSSTASPAAPTQKSVVTTAAKVAASASKTTTSSVKSQAAIKAAAAIASGARANASTKPSPASKAKMMKNLYQQRGATAAKVPAKPAADKTSTEYLRSLLTKKNKSESPSSLITPRKQPSARPAVVTPKDIVIPAEFSPSHTYRATAAYSLLRTLSKELRLSPFTLQSFLTSLMLPIPSKLLGEIHVRVIRILYANIGWGSYAKLGEGDVSKISRRGGSGLGKNVFERRKKKKVGALDEGEIEEEELITKRGGDNLYFLDPTTWPLFFEDYAVASEEKFLDVMELPSIDLDDTENGIEDDDRMEFVNIRSSAMLPLEDIDLNPTTVPRRVGSVLSPNDEKPDFENRCPAGPLGYRNAVGRFVCCPFHIATAVQMFHKMVPGAATPAKSLNASQPSTATHTSVASTGKKRGRPAKKKRGRPPKKGSAKKTHSSRRSSKKVSYTEGSSSSSSDEYSDDESDDDFPSPAKKRKTESTDLSMTVKLSGQHHQTPAVNAKSAQQQLSPSLGIRGTRVLDVEFANTAKPTLTAVSGGSSNVNQPGAAAMVLPATKPSEVTNIGAGLGQVNSTQSSCQPKAQPIMVDLTQPKNAIDLTKSPVAVSKPVAATKPKTENAKPDQSTKQMEESTKPKAPSNNDPQHNKEPLFKVGTIVRVQDRTWPGVNKPGGVARIAKIHLAVPGELCKDGDAGMTKYDVKYVLETRREKGIKEKFISLHSDYVTEEVVDKPLPQSQQVVHPPQPQRISVAPAEVLQSAQVAAMAASGKPTQVHNHPPQCREPTPLNRPHMNNHVPLPVMTNQHGMPFQRAFPPIVVAPVAVPPIDPDALLVSEGVETSLRRFFTSPSTKKADDTKDVTKAEESPLEVTQSPSAITPTSESDDNLLAHMGPMRNLQRGIPYHHLDLNSKLSIMEFLLDELLLVEEISNEMARRQLNTDMMKEPYGKLPEEKEYEEMYNADECLICEVEGDLLCCDGCPSSVHKACIGMAPQGRLPEGKWLCPECRIVDASKPGPLGSEARPLIGWFTLDDLESDQSQDSLVVCANSLEAKGLLNATQPMMAMTMPTPSSGANPIQLSNGDSSAMPNAMIVSSQPTAPSTFPTPSSGISGVNPVQHPIGAPAALSNSMNTSFVGHTAQQNRPQATQQPLPPAGHATQAIGSSGLVPTAQPTFMTNCTQIKQPQAPAQALSNGQPLPPSNVQTLTHQQVHAISAAKKCKIPDDVEFLVTSGMVFARYKSTLQPFDPFNLTNTSSPKPATTSDSVMKPPSPPVPLSAHQLEEVLKLLGPKRCMSLPWHRIPFNPQRTFASIKSGATPENSIPQYIQKLMKAQEVSELGTLVTHQEDTKKYLLNHSEWNNPMAYTNSYRKAPPVAMVKSHQGHFFYPANAFPDINNYPTKTSALSVSLTDWTVNRQGYSLRISYVDPIKSIRDKMTKLERSLNGACLLDMRWGTLEHALDYEWKQKVEQANSIKDLAKLLIKLIDACCLKVFVPDWYKQKENSDDESGRLSPVSDINESSVISDDWNQKHEQSKRKWDRCKGNEILRLFNGFLEEVFNREVPPKSGWKLRKPRDGGNTTRKSDKKSISGQSTTEQKQTAKEDKAAPTPLPSVKGQSNNENDRTVLNGSTSESNPPDDGPGQSTKKESPQESFNPNSSLLAGEKTEASNSSSSTFKALTEDPMVIDSTAHENMDLSPSRKKFRSCGKCDNCLQEDCRECVVCLDMKKYGGKGKIHQKCLKRKDCVMRESFEESTPAKASKTSTKKAKSSKKKARLRRESSAPSNSRRRSDRLNIIRQHIESLLGITEDVTNCTKIEKAITELKLDKLEQVLANDDKAAGYWAIAGKMLFEPDGTLPCRLVKWLARNAGSVRAPSISYDTNYEVGETTVCHHWRKRTMACTTYESLLLSLRILDAHLDKAVMMTASNIASRQASSNKNLTTTAIRIVHTDPLTGFNDYFVIPSGKKRGSWYLEEKVDLSALIQYRSIRRQPWLDKKDQLERERKQKEASLSAARKKEALPASNNKRKTPASSTAKSNPPPKKAKKDFELIKKKETDFQATVNQHRDDTLRLLKASAAKGEASVPAHLMAQSRAANLSKMKAANMAVKCCGGKRLTENELSSRLAKAESDAVQLYISEMKQAKKPTQSQTGSKSQAKQATKPKPVKPNAQPSNTTTAQLSQLSATNKPSAASTISSTHAAHQLPAAAQVSAQSTNSLQKPSSTHSLAPASATNSLQPSVAQSSQSTIQAQKPSQNQSKRTPLPSSSTTKDNSFTLGQSSAVKPGSIVPSQSTIQAPTPFQTQPKQSPLPPVTTTASAGHLPQSLQTQPKNVPLVSSITANNPHLGLTSANPAAMSAQPSKTASKAQYAGTTNPSTCAAPGAFNFERESATISATSSASPQQLSISQPLQSHSQPQQKPFEATQSATSSSGKATQSQSNSSTANQSQKKVFPIYDI